MKLIAIPLAGAVLMALPGCIAKTALDVATAPVKVASKTVDLATTSQSESDEKRGRNMRKHEEQLGKLERNWGELDAQCEAGSEDACRRRDAVGQEIESLRTTSR
jgi:hypothetical protein